MPARGTTRSTPSTGQPWPRSPRTGRAPSMFVGLRTPARTSHPRLANAAHAARPMKPLAPVTRTAVTVSDAAPDRAVHVVGIADDCVDHFGSDVVDVVVRRHAPSAASACEPLGRYLHGFENALRLDAGHDHRAFIHALGALVRLAEHDAGEADDRCLFGQRPAVGEHAKRRFLQLHVVGKAKGWHETDSCRRPLAERCETLSCPWMR